MGKKYSEEKWNDKFGKNFTENDGMYKQAMMQKNMETDGSYQASVSGMYGEFTIASIFKALPEEYIVMNDILLQMGIQYRRYGIKEFNRYGVTPWELAYKEGKVYKRINKTQALAMMRQNNKLVFYEVVKKSTQLDHVIVSPYGIFVIETKNHKGYVFGDVNGRVWTQVLNNGRSHYTFYNPVHQNIGHMDELSKQLKMPVKYMVGMVVFTNPEAYLGNVNCNCCYTVDMLFRAILNYTMQLWDMKKVDKIVKAIESIDDSSYSNSKEHELYVKDIKYRQDVNKRLKRGT